MQRRDHPRQSEVSSRGVRTGGWVCVAGVWVSVSRMSVVLRLQQVGSICCVSAVLTWDCWRTVCGACSSPLPRLIWLNRQVWSVGAKMEEVGEGGEKKARAVKVRDFPSALDIPSKKNCQQPLPATSSYKLVL